MKTARKKNAYFGFAELEGDLGLCGERESLVLEQG